jgi:YcxB-like protein
MRYNYTLTYRDFLDAQKLYRRHRTSAGVKYYFAIWLLPIVGFIVGLPFILSLLGYQPSWADALSGFSVLGLWFAFAIPLVRFYTVRKCWKRLLPDSLPRSIRTEIPVGMEMTSDQLISSLPGRSEGRFMWPALVDYAEDEKLALVFVKKKFFLFVPRRAMDDAGWIQLRSCFANSRTSSSC